MRRRFVAAGAVGLALLAITTEVALPSLAEDRVRDELATLGSVTSVELSTSPAAKLLFGRVESAAVRMSDATLDENAVGAEMLERARTVDVLDAHIGTLHVGPLDVRSVALGKRGQALDASATLDIDEIESLVPGAQLTVEDGNMVLELPELPLPLPGPIRLEIVVDKGRVIARPLGSASALLPPQALVQRPELSITRLRSRITDGQVSLRAHALLNS